MKRLSPRHELIRHRALLLVGQEGAVLNNDLFAKLLKPRFHHSSRGFSVEVVDRQFKESASEEASFHSTGFGFWQETLARLNFQNSQTWLISGKRYGEIQGMSRGPSNQFFRGVSPLQTKRRGENCLSVSSSQREAERQNSEETVKTPVHGLNVGHLNPARKTRCAVRGMVLLEAMLSLSILTVLGLLLLKLSLNILNPRQTILQQTITDAYLTYERAYAERIPFETLLSSSSPWPAHPSVSTSTVEIGRLPGNRVINGTVTRTRFPDDSNFPIDGGSGTLATNPAAMKVWKAQSVITYQIGNRSYAKSRTVLRSQ